MINMGKTAVLFTLMVLVPVFSFAGQPFDDLQMEINQTNQNLANEIAARQAADAAEIEGRRQGDIDTLGAAKQYTDALIANLQNQIASIQTALTDAQNKIAQLETTLAGMDTVVLGRLAELANYVSVEQGPINFLEGPHVIFEGANVHVRSGSGYTFPGPTNGLGNLIVGYNEAPASWVAPVDYRTGSHNLIIGPFHTYSSYSGFVAGHVNNIVGPYASVSGGHANTASGILSSVSGGEFNTASGWHSSVSGGYQNTASGIDSSISGGLKNDAIGEYTSVSGGFQRSAIDQYNWAAGGLLETH